MNDRSSWVRRPIAAAGALALLAGCAGGGARSEADAIGARLQAGLDSLVAANPSVPGIQLAVLDSARGLHWTGAAGLEMRGGGPLQADQPVRIASTTKTFTAAAILRLAEQGKVDLDASIARYLPDELLAVLVSDGYQVDSIKVRQVLSQTSGIFDYAFGEGSNFGEVALGDLQHRWTRLEQVQFAARAGDPVGPPGQQYHYSDTGYVLLGAIIEQVSGLPLAQAYRQLLKFDQLGLESTWLESLEPAPAGVAERAHQYAGDLDSFDADPSFDLFGGGGLVATAEDMAEFYHALLGGKVFDDPKTLEAMLTVPAVNETGPRAYALGIARAPLAGETCWGHGGFWGTMGLACPTSGLAIGFSINQNEGTGEVRNALLELVESALASAPGS